jgi:hydrogenase maturation protease
MSLDEQIKEKMDSVLVPGVKRSPIALNLVRDIAVSDGKADITIANAALAEEIQEWLSAMVSEKVGQLSGIEKVNVKYTDSKPAEVNKIGKVIAIMSGKGGVGKSLVTALTAVSLQRKGHAVGILDADITGPSIPRMFGINERPTGSNTGILPVLSKSGIELMSINLLLPNEDEAVIWRGPLIGKTITQFWEDVLWGTLDYLVVDLPPGTADAPLTVLQQLPVSGVVVVFTPQDLTAMVVRKAVSMARKMEKSILGVVENMAYLHVAEIDKKIEIFGPSQGDKMSATVGAPLLGQLPIDPELARLCDAGEIEKYASDKVTDLGDQLSQVLNPS